jgi:hypothetical protein
LGESAAPPTSGNEAKSRIAAPDSFRVNFGVVPATRPREISDGVSLSDKERREDRAFVPEKRTLDPFLLRDRVVDVVSPNENSVPCIGSEDDVFTGADELIEFRALVSGAVVPPVQSEATSVSVLREPPQRTVVKGSDISRPLPQNRAITAGGGANFDLDVAAGGVREPRTLFQPTGKLLRRRGVAAMFMNAVLSHHSTCP